MNKTKTKGEIIKPWRNDLAMDHPMMIQLNTGSLDAQITDMVDLCPYIFGED